MERTYAAIALTLAICVMAIPAAYLMGQRSALEMARRHYEESLARARGAYVESAANSAPRASETSPAGGQIPRVGGASERSDAQPAIQLVLTDDSRPPDTVRSAEAKTPPAPPIPQSAFDAADMGTSYEQVVREFGREGEPMMLLEDGDGTVTTQYAWDWLDAEGNAARIRMQFVDGRLIDKSISD